MMMNSNNHNPFW